MPQPDFLSQVAIKSDYIAGATTLSKMTLEITTKNLHSITTKMQHLA
jgi:hypothetical protein